MCTGCCRPDKCIYNSKEVAQASCTSTINDEQVYSASNTALCTVTVMNGGNSNDFDVDLKSCIGEDRPDGRCTSLEDRSDDMGVDLESCTGGLEDRPDGRCTGLGLEDRSDDMAVDLESCSGDDTCRPDGTCRPDTGTKTYDAGACSTCIATDWSRQTRNTKCS